MSANNSHSIRIINEVEDGYTAYYSCCGEFQVVFGQIFLRLQKQDLKVLTQSLITSKTKKCCRVESPMGERHMLKSPHQEILFLFTKNELNRFIYLMEQTHLMVDAWEITGQLEA